MFPALTIPLNGDREVHWSEVNISGFHTPLSNGLRENLTPVLADTHAPGQLNHVIRIAQALASSLLASKHTAWTLMDVHGIQLDDLACDCVAEIFSSYNGVPCAQLKAYFEGISVQSASEHELLIHFRRLVFSKVQEGVFRLYHEVDPTLSKILRNIKIAVQSLRLFSETERRGETCIAPSLCETLEHLPPVERDLLEEELRVRTRGDEHIPEMMTHLSRYLREQTTHSRIVPLIAVAITFRKVYAMRQEPAPELIEPQDEMITKETAAIIKDACTSVKKQNVNNYVGKGKVESAIFDHYFLVIEEALTLRIIGQDGHDNLFYELLRTHHPSMSKEAYKEGHKNKIEYLARQAQELALNELRTHFQP